METTYWGILIAAGLLAFGESALGLGLVIPGETAIIALSATIDTHQILAVVLAVAAGAIAGDNLGYLLGRRFGPRLQHSKIVARIGSEKWDRATALMTRYGLPAVLVSRLLPVVRTIMPAVAGASRFRYGRFLFASVAGAAVWAGLWVGLGSSLHATGLSALPAVAAAAVVGIGIVVLSRSKAWRRVTAGPQSVDA